MFTDTVVRQIVAVAEKASIKPAALLAVVECETNGAPFENDGKTPRLLYERHVAYRHAKKVGAAMLNAFTKAKLAIPKWSRTTQYKDQGTSAGRLAVIARARAIDEEIANASASWGLGQSMGENGPELGFASATDLVRFMTAGGLPAQLDVLVREIKNKRLISALNRGDFVTFARTYNGPAYAQNQYDTRMAAAYKRWLRKLPTVLARDEEPVEQTLSVDEIKAIQRRLAELGYKMVGRPDGDWGVNTKAAISAFQLYEGLPETGVYDDATKAALSTARPRVQPKARVEATEDDLRGVSRIVDTADSLSFAAKAKIAVGLALAGGGTSEQAGLLGQAQDAVDKVNQAKGLWDTAHGWLAPLVGNPTTILIGIVLIAGGLFVAKYAKRIIEARLDDHRSGAHTGANT